jgi:hypothetical protein
MARTANDKQTMNSPKVMPTEDEHDNTDDSLHTENYRTDL